MNKLLFISLLNIFIVASSQEKTMDKKERIAFLESKIQQFDRQPIYTLDYFTRSHSEVYINDVLVYANYTDNKGNITVPMNYAILKKGMQKLRIVLYPNPDEQVEAFINFSVMKAQWKNGIYDQKPPILQHEIENISLIQGTKWEKEFTFFADVPYELKGWSESENLIELHKKENIKPKVEAVFRAIWKDWNNKDADAIDTRELIKQSEINIFDYRNKAYITEQQNTLEKVFIDEKDVSQMLPLEHYEMYIMGDGKVVTLLRTDRENKMEHTIGEIKKSKKGEIESVSTYYYFLHIPKGKTEFEVIR